MKRIYMVLLCVLLVSTLAGCGALDDEYLAVSPSEQQAVAEENEDILIAENYLSLQNAILYFVENGIADGVIRVHDYSGNLEDELPSAVYEVTKRNPLGAYAVDNMTYDYALIVSYYEIHIKTVFRRSVEQIQAIERVAGSIALDEKLTDAMEAFKPSLVVRIPYYNNQDPKAMIQTYYNEQPAMAVQMPEVTVNIYPDSGNVRILEILMSYDQPIEMLKEKQRTVMADVRTATDYVRYRITENGKLQLLYAYFLERFTYTKGVTSTPVYSFLCEGIIGSEGCAKGLQAICEEIGIECYTVLGSRNGDPYYWNIVCLDEEYCHIDLLEMLTSGTESLELHTDAAMTEYLWDQSRYPACE